MGSSHHLVNLIAFVSRTLQAANKDISRNRMKNNDKAEDAGNNAHVTVNSLYSFFNHSCDPNVISKSTNTGRVELFASKDIAKGAEAFISYIASTDLEWPTADRQQMLMPWLAQKCACTRCKALSQKASR